MEIWLERSWFLVMMETTTPWQMAPRRKRLAREKRRNPLPRRGTRKEELAHDHGEGEVEHADGKIRDQFAQDQAQRCGWGWR